MEIDLTTPALLFSAISLIMLAYINLTLQLMRDFGAQADWVSEDCITVSPGGYTDTPFTVEQAGLSPPYILYDKLGVSGSKEPVPVQYGCQQGDDACDGENPLNDVLAHQK